MEVLGNRKLAQFFTLLYGVATASIVAAQDSTLSDLSELSLEELVAIEITSVSKRPEQLNSAVAAVHVITGDEIRRSGAKSLPEALKLAPNLHVAQRGSQSWAISSRGFNTELANKLLVMIDGRSIYTPLYSGVSWDKHDYPLEDIEQIEVISGPGGTLWGANAVNGIINIITKSSRETQGTFGEAVVGTELRKSGTFRYGGNLDADNTFRLYTKYSDRDGQVFRDGTDSPDTWNMLQGGFRIDSILNGNYAGDFTIQGDIYTSESISLTGREGRSKGYNLLSHWRHTLENGSNVSLLMYYDYTYARSPVEPRTIDPGIVVAAGGYLKDELDTFNLDFSHDLVIGERHHVIWGLGYRFTRNKIENAPALQFSPENMDRELVNIFLQDEIRLSDNLSFLAGVKFEYNDYTALEIQPSMRIRYQPDDKSTIWAAVSRAVRTPSRVDRDVRFPTPVLAPDIENLLIGGENFDSEKVIAYEVGYRNQPDKAYSIDLAFFYNEYRDIRSASLSPVTIFPVYFANDLEGNTHGLELDTNFQLHDNWRVGAGFAVLKEDIRVVSGGVDINNALNETADPEKQFKLHSQMNLPSDVELDIGFRWIDEFVVNNSGSGLVVPAHKELDVRLGWRLSQNVEVEFVFKNLLDEYHLEYLTPGADGEPVEIQRSFLISASTDF